MIYDEPQRFHMDPSLLLQPASWSAKEEKVVSIGEYLSSNDPTIIPIETLQNTELIDVASELYSQMKEDAVPLNNGENLTKSQTLASIRSVTVNGKELMDKAVQTISQRLLLIQANKVYFISNSTENTPGQNQ